MTTTHEVLHAEIAGWLGDTDCEWSQSEADDERWHAVVSDQRGQRCELTAAIVGDGVEIATTLAQWDAELAAPCSAAVTRFLDAAQQKIPGASLNRCDRTIRAISFVARERLDIQLNQAIAAVVAASGLVRREVQALAVEPVAQAYLERLESPGNS